jgi:hypothetical protein
MAGRRCRLAGRGIVRGKPVGQKEVQAFATRKMNLRRKRSKGSL